MTNEYLQIPYFNTPVSGASEDLQKVVTNLQNPEHVAQLMQSLKESKSALLEHAKMVANPNTDLKV